MIDLSTAKDPPAAWECPYCLTFRESSYPPAAELIFLQGSDAGYRGIVVASPRVECREHEFLVKMEYEKREGHFRIASTERDRCLRQSHFEIPRWMPELSMDDNAALHESLLRNIRCLFLAENRAELTEGLHGVIGCLWWRRFPLRGEDLWPMLFAHGVQMHLKEEAEELIDFGLNLLRRVQGRAPIKKKRMRPMSQRSYQTERQRGLHIRISGHP